ncbi:hypothetical protein NE237_017592 [Protea cynaroides]|uniref:Uncharacterized protein n=1 Tax=Protea cynaroides TaxID=273540 RepID=A0A9Q0QN72_9MAGN|nr:hypothetical protein NE237_017592 [Protea cynaroides]
MDAMDNVVDPLREFAKDSVRLVKRCHKPDRKEFTKVAFRKWSFASKICTGRDGWVMSRRGGYQESLEVACCRKWRREMQVRPCMLQGAEERGEREMQVRPYIEAASAVTGAEGRAL